SQELRGRLDLLGPHKGFELPRHLRRLGWQVLQKFLKERIWICQGQLHGMLLLWTGGVHVSSMQYALISYDLQLILALMPYAVAPASEHLDLQIWSALEGAQDLQRRFLDLGIPDSEVSTYTEAVRH